MKFLRTLLGKARALLQVLWQQRSLFERLMTVFLVLFVLLFGISKLFPAIELLAIGALYCLCALWITLFMGIMLSLLAQRDTFDNIWSPPLRLLVFVFFWAAAGFFWAGGIVRFLGFIRLDLDMRWVLLCGVFVPWPLVIVIQWLLHRGRKVLQARRLAQQAGEKEE